MPARVGNGAKLSPAGVKWRKIRWLDRNDDELSVIESVMAEKYNKDSPKRQ